MNIIILTSLFYPEIAANSKKMTHLAEALKENGHTVHVITAFPYYSTSKNFERYQGKWISKEEYNNIHVIRTYAYASKNYRNIYNRLLSFISFCFSSIAGSFTINDKIDMVLVISPPFLSIFSGYIVSRIKKARLVLDIQDIYPETLVSLGFLKNKIAIKILESIERFFYRKTDGVVAISDGFRQDFINKGTEFEKIKVIHNWVDVDKFYPVIDNESGKKNDLENRFVVMFMGTIGFAQGLDTLVEAANILKRYEQKIQFVLLGDGVEKERIKAMVAEYSLSNFTFIEPKPNSEIPGFLSLADVYLVCLRKNKLYEITIPCKTYEYMAMGKPIIMAAEGEARKLIEYSECGIGVEPGSFEGLAEAILYIYNNRNLVKEMGRRGREYVSTHFSKKVITNQYIEFLNGRICK